MVDIEVHAHTCRADERLQFLNFKIGPVNFFLASGKIIF